MFRPIAAACALLMAPLALAACGNKPATGPDVAESSKPAASTTATIDKPDTDPITVASTTAPDASVAVSPDAVEIEFTDIDGKKRSLSEFYGKRILVDFWATTWGGCIRTLDGYHKDSGNWPSNFVIIAIAMDRDPVKAAKLAADHGWTNSFAMIACSGLGANDPAFKQFDVTKTPHQVLIDADGTVIADQHHIKDVKALLE